MKVMRDIRVSVDSILYHNPLLEVVMNYAFDCALITDNEGYIVKAAETAPLVWGVPISEIIDKHITEVEGSALSKLILGGKSVLNKMLIINGMNCFTHIIPLYNDREEQVGSFCAIVHRGMEKLESLVEDIPFDEEDESTIDAITKSGAKYTFNDFIGVSDEILSVIKIAKKASQYNYPVLIRGETGTGKELIASGIHLESQQKRKLPFVKINCTAIPKYLLESELFGHEKGAFTGAFTRKRGKFEIAGDGTILLDEIGDMDLSLQGKILRVLEEREFERVGGNEVIKFGGRIIASTNRNLENMIKLGKFREDLYYRLSTIEINLPPVRNCKENALLLIKHFMNKSNLHTPFSPGAIEILKNYHWPGNVRQIKNVVAKLSLLEDVRIYRADHIREILMPVHVNDNLDKDYITKGISKKNDFKDILNYKEYELDTKKSFKSDDKLGLDEIEKQHIKEILQQTNMNVAESARLLGISRNTLYNKIKKYNIELRKIIV
ncbi:MAG: sigma 54-interacting transcriptional regulator [Clostridiales bacterium]|nr:sigma 54-interacting transcriptional regulator [Clostridiales bacterium]